MSRSVEKDSEWEKDPLSDDEQQIRTTTDSISDTTSMQLVNMNNDQEPDIDDDFQNYVPSGGHIVQESDVMIIEELKEDVDHYQNISEWSDAYVLYEFPEESEDDINGSLKQVYFDNTNNTASEEPLAITDISEISTRTEIHNLNEKKVLPTSSSRKERDKDTKPEAVIKILEPSRIDSSSSENETCFKEDSDWSNNNVEYIQVDIKHFRNFSGHANSGSNYVTCSSDEFADIEDNIPDSSDSCDTDSPMKRNNLKTVESVRQQENLRTEQKVQNALMGKYASTSQINCCNHNAVDCCSSEESKKFKDEGRDEIYQQMETQNIMHSDSEEQHESLEIHAGNQINNAKSLAGKIQNDPKKNFVSYMPTIKEVPEKENRVNDNQPSSSQANPLKMKPNVSRNKKCGICNTRLGLCAIHCRCGNLYCAKHRYDKEHNCTFDYKAMGAAEIRKNNPKVIADKIQKL